jgi:ankyrin repeat-rich membrane spanning protein
LFFVSIVESGVKNTINQPTIRLSDIGILLFQYGTTPLIWACRKGHLANVEALLDAGANVDAVGMVRLYV